MRILKCIIVILITFLHIVLCNLMAQHSKEQIKPLSVFDLNKILGEMSEIKELIIDDNEITSVVFNYGSIGSPNYLGNIADLVWKKLGYMFEFGPLLAAKVVNGNGDTLKIVSDSYVRFSPLQGDYSPDGTVKWGWLPEVGYVNQSQNEIANSKDPNSWPGSWSNWPGEFGDGVIIAENEVYYSMNDFTNAEFEYYPFPDDSSKRGLGVSAKVRIYQFTGPLKDAVVVKYFITNESPKKLDEVYFGFHGDTHIGGPSDYADDRVGIVHSASPPFPSKYERSYKTVYNWDDDMSGDYGRWCGYLNFHILESPNNLGLTSFHPAVYTNTFPNVPANDSLMFKWLSTGIDTTNSILNEAGDWVINFGTGPFNLDSGETKIVKLAIFLSESYDDMIKDAAYISLHHNWPFMQSNAGASAGDNDYQIALTSPTSGPLSGDVNINWNYSGTNDTAKVLVECSHNLGKDWTLLDIECDKNGNYIWNTLDYNDGVNYLLRLVAYNPNNPSKYYYDILDSRLKIDNPGVNAKPELSIDIPFESTTVTSSPVNINWTCEDADDLVLNVAVQYSVDDGQTWNTIINENHANGNFTHAWNCSGVPNSNNCKIKIIASDGNSDTTEISEKFGINIYKEVFTPAHVRHISGDSDADIYIQVIEPDSLKDEEYRITFDCTTEKTFSIQNRTTMEWLVVDYPLVEGLSTPMFDGIKVLIKDKEVGINYDDTKFNRSELDSIFYVFYSPLVTAYLGNPHVKVQDDWLVVFNDLDTLGDGSYKYPGDRAWAPNNTPPNDTVTCPFFLINVDANTKGNFIVDQSKAGKKNTKWDFEEQIILRKQIPASFAEVTYCLQFYLDKGILPGFCDTLFIVTYNTVENDDIFVFSPDSNFVVGIKDKQIVSDYRLYQNYPNPFNPTTNIEFEIPLDSKVTIKIYNILGQEIATLINKELMAGKHKVQFNASELSSGVYIYRITADSFSKSMKMILMK